MQCKKQFTLFRTEQQCRDCIDFKKHQKHQSVSFLLNLFIRKKELKYVALALRADAIKHIQNTLRKKRE